MHPLIPIGLVVSLAALASTAILARRSRRGQHLSRSQMLTTNGAAAVGMWLAAIGLALQADTTVMGVFAGILLVVSAVVSVMIGLLWGPDIRRCFQAGADG